MVDDEADIRESLEAAARPRKATRGPGAERTEGLQKMEARGYDLVLLDLMMPDRSGMEVLRGRSRARPRDARSS